METRLRHTEVPANTRYRLDTYNSNRPELRHKLDSMYKNDDWVRITDVDQYKRWFPPYTHAIVRRWEDWIVLVHKADKVFMEDPYFNDLKSEILDHYDNLGALLYSRKRHEDDMNVWDLVDFVYEEMREEITVDLETLELTYTELDKADQIDYNGLTRDKLRGLCKENGLPVSGNIETLKERLINFNGAE